MKDKETKLNDAIDKYRVKCKCGHKTVIPKGIDKRVCWWCGLYVYREEKIKFKEKLSQAIKKANV